MTTYLSIGMSTADFGQLVHVAGTSLSAANVFWDEFTSFAEGGGLISMLGIECEGKEKLPKRTDFTLHQHTQSYLRGVLNLKLCFYKGCVA